MHNYNRDSGASPHPAPTDRKVKQKLYNVLSTENKVVNIIIIIYTKWKLILS